MVDDTGIEPVTPSMSRKCSTAEPIVQVAQCYFIIFAPDLFFLILTNNLNLFRPIARKNMEVETGFEPV